MIVAYSSGRFFQFRLKQDKGNLVLGLTTLTDTAARALAHHRGSQFLHGLIELSDAAAEALTHRNGGLFINVDKLPESAAEILRPHVSREGD